MNMDFKETEKIELIISSLCILKNLKNDIVINKYRKLVNYLDEENIKLSKVLDLYNDFSYELLNKNINGSFKNYIIDIILKDNNIFTNMIEHNNLTKKFIINQVSKELKLIQYVCSITSDHIKELIISKIGTQNFEIEIIKNLISWNEEALDDGYSDKALDSLKLEILKSNNWGENLEKIVDFYTNYGTGEFAEYRAFIWEHEEERKYLRGVESPDPIRLADLIGYEDQKETIIENTEQFLKGNSANNILLYGSRGTGKSSTVKAIVNEYYKDGLRLIEVDKSRLVDFTKIIKILKNKNLKFIIFVDDLVFQEGESSYSALKTILEGGVENRSDNILIYATTNRRHLVKETFSEREGDDVHASDSIEEKLSLSDRFGITVSFYSPDQKEYLKIVDGIVEAKGLEVNEEYLHTEALKWIRWHNARSPRTAKQFINWLEGNLKNN